MLYASKKFQFSTSTSTSTSTLNLHCLRVSRNPVPRQKSKSFRETFHSKASYQYFLHLVFYFTVI